MKTVHAILAPSGAERWMTCIGAPAMEANCPDETNEYADEGTAAHALASMCLTTNNDPAAYEGRVLTVINGVYVPNVTEEMTATEVVARQKRIPPTQREFVVDDSMIENVRTYVNAIREYATLGQLHVEQRVSISHITGEKDAEGTSDAVIECPAQRELQVHDLKYGMGVQVFAERNPQLMMYALGALAEFDPTGEDYDTVRLVIHQPRLGHLDEWVCPVTTLLAWGYNEATPKAAKALTVLKSGVVSSDLHASEAACRFCKAKATCPELARTVSEAVFGDFNALDAQKTPEIILPATSDLVAHRMGRVEMVEDWCKAVRAKTDSLLRSGEPVTGWKLVVGKKGNRKWGDESAVIKLLKGMRLKITEMYKMTVLSPTAAEKFLKPTPKRWAQLVPLITQEPGTTHVAPEKDTRPAYVPPNAADDFTADDGSDLV